MESWIYWIYLKIALSAAALVICASSAVFVWRARGLWLWQRSLSSEIKALEKNAQAINGPRRLAILKVLQRCREIRRSNSLDFDQILHLDLYLRSIAECYHPDAARPELCLSFGQILTAVREMVDRLDQVIQRKGLRRFARIRIRHVRQAMYWYRRIYNHSKLGWLIQHYGTITRLMHIKRFVFPDPFSWIAYFSNQLTILILTRTLFLDLYLFIGNLAIEAYDPKHLNNENSIDSDRLAETLATLYDSEQFTGWRDDPDLVEIRTQLIGMPKRIILPPTFALWRESILKAANVIAKRHYSQSNAPLEEAALGPIILQLQHLLHSVSEIRHYTGVGRFFELRLASVYRAHGVAENLGDLPLTGVLQKAWGGYRRLRWPIRMYRWIKRSSPSGIAMDLGWEALRKTLINFMARFTFDRVCREIDGVYRNSKKKDE